MKMNAMAQDNAQTIVVVIMMMNVIYMYILYKNKIELF